MDTFFSFANLAFLSQLEPDPQTDEFAPNQGSRQVTSGHYVTVNPQPLSNPVLLAYNAPFLQELGFNASAIERSTQFVNFFSGHMEASPFTSWCTPYATSIYGQEIYSNCPFGTGIIGHVDPDPLKFCLLVTLSHFVIHY